MPIRISDISAVFTGQKEEACLTPEDWQVYTLLRYFIENSEALIGQRTDVLKRDFQLLIDHGLLEVDEDLAMLCLPPEMQEFITLKLI